MGDSGNRNEAGSVDANRLLVIVPAWNEESTIGATLRELRAAVSEADLLVVDDGSTDRTSEVARFEGATVLSLPYNLGVGGAMRAGYKYARRRGYSRAIQVDADGQHDPKDIEAVLAGLAKADISIGASGTFRAIDFDGSPAGAGDRPIPGLSCTFARFGACLTRLESV